MNTGRPKLTLVESSSASGALTLESVSGARPHPYATEAVFADVTVEVLPGETAGIWSPTITPAIALFRALETPARIDSGRALLDGSPLRRGQIMLLEPLVSTDPVSVSGQFARRISRLLDVSFRRARRLAAQHAEEFGLAELADCDVRNLDAVSAQNVALADAFVSVRVQRPAFVAVADPSGPATGADARDVVRTLIEYAAASGVGAIFASRDVALPMFAGAQYRLTPDGMWCEFAGAVPPPALRVV